MERRPRRNLRSVTGCNYPAKKNHRSVPGANYQAKKDAIRSLTELPLELQSEILVKLPAKSLLFCKCVCKSLRALISDANFVQSHLNRFNCPQKSLLVDQSHPDRLDSPQKSLLLHLYDDKYLKHPPRNPRNLSLTPLLHKISDKIYGVRLVGSCNGLIVIAVWFGNNFIDDLIVWNPVIGQHRYLPKSNYCRWFGVYSLGFIPETNDYMILKVCRREKEMMLYRTSTDSWTTIDCSAKGADLIDKVSEHGYLVFFNGAFHWAAETIKDTDIVYYNLKDEEIGVIKAINHNGFEGFRNHLKKVVVIDGSLGMMYWVLGYTFPCEIWVMNDYGVEETWSRRFVIHQDTSDHDHVIRFMGGLSTSSLVVVNELEKRGKRKDYKYFSTFLLYDLNTRSMMNIAIIEDKCSIKGVYDFVETLVPVIKAESVAE